MAVINKIENIAEITYDGSTIGSLPATTLILVLPTIVKNVDKAVANIGDDLTYTVTITNIGLVAMTAIPFSDTVPPGAEYIDGTFKLNGSTVTPTIMDRTLSYTIPNISALGIATVDFQVEVVGGET
jgi:uncharacterized repeat protein (TIGR01451 family)